MTPWLGWFSWSQMVRTEANAPSTFDLRSLVCASKSPVALAHVNSDTTTTTPQRIQKCCFLIIANQGLSLSIALSFGGFQDLLRVLRTLRPWLHRLEERICRLSSGQPATGWAEPAATRTAR